MLNFAGAATMLRLHSYVLWRRQRNYHFGKFRILGPLQVVDDGPVAVASVKRQKSALCHEIPIPSGP
jgi:hypothetical protein